MPLDTVENIVRGWLPFLPAATVNPTIDQKLVDYKIQTYYFLQSYLGIADVDVEVDGTYTGVKRLLVAAIEAYDLLNNKALENIGGTAGGTASGGKHLKKGKADVVEAEFEYSKASDGNSLIAKTDTIMANLKSKICEYAATLQIRLPMCDCEADSNAIYTFKAYTCDE